MTGIGEVNSSNVQLKSGQSTIKPDQDFLNSIFEVDGIGNHNGEVDEEDFKIALNSGVINNQTKQKVVGWYMTFLAKCGNGELVGNHRIVSVEIPLLGGNKYILRGTYDEKTGKLLTQTQSLISENNGVTTVKTERVEYGKKDNKTTKAEYSYSRELLEQHVMFEGQDSNGNIIQWFKSIPEIRKLPEAMRTPQQKELLAEFDRMIDLAIEVGNEYNIDPKLVLTIIEREVGFDGFGTHSGRSVTGSSGKGYMQLTTAPIADFLGKYTDKKTKVVGYSDIKESLYGQEMTDLLVSHGFDVNSANTKEKKADLQNRIMKYLKDNKDPEFNIRLGTLVLRYYMNKANGDVKTAATNYNGSPHKVAYGKFVDRVYDRMDNAMPTDSTYVRTTTPRF